MFCFVFKTPSLARVQHANIYENTPPGIPFVRGVLHSLILNSSFISLPTCLAQDEQNRTFPISITNTSQNAFLISLPENYTLNSTARPTFLINVLCQTSNQTTVDEVSVVSLEFSSIVSFENNLIDLRGLRTSSLMFYRLHPH